MAKTPLTKVEIKTKLAELKAAAKLVNEEHGKFVADHKAAERLLAGARKDADKAVAAAAKVVDAAAKKLEKATSAKEKGLAKIDKEMLALSPKAKSENAEEAAA